MIRGTFTDGGFTGCTHKEKCACCCVEVSDVMVAGQCQITAATQDEFNAAIKALVKAKHPAVYRGPKKSHGGGPRLSKDEYHRAWTKGRNGR